MVDRGIHQVHPLPLLLLPGGLVHGGQILVTQVLLHTTCYGPEHTQIHLYSLPVPVPYRYILVTIIGIGND